FLWGRGGALRWFHFGEGDYEATERAIQDELRITNGAGSLPPPMAPLRPSDSAAAVVIAPTEEVLPGGSLSEPWSPTPERAASAPPASPPRSRPSSSGLHREPGSSRSRTPPSPREARSSDRAAGRRGSTTPRASRSSAMSAASWATTASRPRRKRRRISGSAP